MLERLTFRYGDGKAYIKAGNLVKFDLMKPKNINQDYESIIRVLLENIAEYEDTGLTPDEIVEHEKMFKSYRSICGGLSPDEVITMLTLAKSQITTAADNVRLQELVQKMAKYIYARGNGSSVMCKYECLDKRIRCTDCIIKYFEGEKI